ncbi:MAG TPA: SCP2 sterol-binding domain-containing protein [Egibacteraceae bacterium]|nr:SCP2 sterol-binding domain-containing protein [Egibacteraceae bacterium]
MVQFATQEWLDEYRERINSSPVYREALQSWEGTIVYLFEAEEGLFPRTRCALLDVWRGECRGARLVEEADALVANAPLLIRAPYTRWKQLVRRELDPVRALMQGLLRFRGDMRTIVRNVRAQSQLFTLAGEIPTEFPDDD